MANNYLQYSTQYNFPRAVSDEESEKIMLHIMKEGAREYSDLYGEEIDEETPLDEQYIGTSLDMEKEGVWFYAEEGGYPEVVAAMIASLQEYFEDDRKHVFSWAYTCSKMRLDEFGGGAAGIVRGQDIYIVDAASYVANHLDR
jgi:hypothetical protein